MVKSIIKEIIIMLLLCVAILLILGVLFYDYIPSNKVVPGKIAYSTPENIQEEVNEEVIEANKTKITYEVTDADLNIYKQSNSYVPGKEIHFLWNLLKQLEIRLEEQLIIMEKLWKQIRIQTQTQQELSLMKLEKIINFGYIY